MDELARAPELNPASLPMGTLVEGWRVVGWRGRGSYGAVYRAERVGQEAAGPVALKLALLPRDPRFEREVELLSRLQQSGVPALLAHGTWRLADRTYPYLVMQWVEGSPLYDWAAARNPTSRQVLRLLAQVARALEATHAAGCVHRDVKGDNVLVHAGDGRAFLVDFGSGRHEGAATLTWQTLPPGTPAYRSPEAWRFAVGEGRRSPEARYAAEPADDVFALGVTAYRLVTDEYPPPADPGGDEAGLWREQGPGPLAPLVLNPRVDPWLSVIILRMLSIRPKARGTAGELAQALEEAAERVGPQADQPLFLWEMLPPTFWSREEAAAAYVLGHRPRRRSVERVRAAEQQDAAARAEAERREGGRLARVRAHVERTSLHWHVLAALLGGTTAAVVCFWVLTARESEHVPLEEEPPSIVQEEQRDAGTEDGGTSGLADAVLAEPVESARAAREWRGFGLDVPKRPLPGQRRPDSNGSCGPRVQMVAIQGSCWLRIADAKPPCEKDEYAWGGSCYVPMFDMPKLPTSDHP